MKKLSSVFHPKVEKPDITYPCLMKSDAGSIFLFSRARCGTCVCEVVGGVNRLGGYCDSLNMHYFTPITGSVTITA